MLARDKPVKCWMTVNIWKLVGTVSYNFKLGTYQFFLLLTYFKCVLEVKNICLSFKQLETKAILVRHLQDIRLVKRKSVVTGLNTNLCGYFLFNNTDFIDMYTVHVCCFWVIGIPGLVAERKFWLCSNALEFDKLLVFLVNPSVTVWCVVFLYSLGHMDIQDHHNLQLMATHNLSSLPQHQDTCTAILIMFHQCRYFLSDFK